MCESQWQIHEDVIERRDIKALRRKKTGTTGKNAFSRNGRQMYCVIRDANGQKVATDTFTMTMAN